MTDEDDGAWFAPKAYGYGSSVPVRWQGWAMLLIHAGIVAACVLPLKGSHPLLGTMLALILALAPLPLYAAKTRGGWRWRWGGD